MFFGLFILCVLNTCSMRHCSLIFNELTVYQGRKGYREMLQCNMGVPRSTCKRELTQARGGYWDPRKLFRRGDAWLESWRLSRRWYREGCVRSQEQVQRHGFRNEWLIEGQQNFHCILRTDHHLILNLKYFWFPLLPVLHTYFLSLQFKPSNLSDISPPSSQNVAHNTQLLANIWRSNSKTCRSHQRNSISTSGIEVNHMKLPFL